VHSVIPSVSYGDFSESQLVARVDALLRELPAAVATSSSTNADGPFDGIRKLPPSDGTNRGRRTPRPAATADEE
jgi:hypothetical protein